jgi:acyl carrier protein
MAPNGVVQVPMNFQASTINFDGCAAPLPRDTIRALVADILAAQGQTEPFSDDDTLAEIGIGSVDMVTLLLALESTFNLEVPPHEITIDVFRSIGTLDAMVRRLQPFRVAAPQTHAAPHHLPINRALCDNVTV